MASPIWLDGRSGRRSGSIRSWVADDNVFLRSSTVRREIDDEEALKWAALEKLPTYDRVRKSYLKSVVGENTSVLTEIDVTNLAPEDRQDVLGRILKVTDEDNERLLLKLRNRIDQVGIDLPKIEVRFEHLNVKAEAHLGSRALPTLLNSTLNFFESILSSLRLISSNKTTLEILKDVSGIIKPARMTLLLGPPGSGKTTLLLALSGKLDRSLEVSGRVTYNGHDMEEFVPQRTSIYISQHDLHIGEMTVRETLDFSSRCQGVGSRYEMLEELSRREKLAGIKPDADIDVFMKAGAIEGQESSISTDYILKILGLDICADTVVGDNMRRGISGGQKKRVTTGEMIVGPAKALFMDEISTGLDSSTTFQIVKFMRQYVHVMDGTAVISLLQPAPETYELFDDVILISEGQLVYQGPRQYVLDFFEQMGFKCPERKGVADFLQEVTSKMDQEQYWADKRKPYRYIAVNEFANAFKSFHVGAKLEEELKTPFDKSKSHPAALTTSKYALSQWELLKANFAREVLLMKRNSFVYVFRTVQMAITAFITMTVFLRTKMHVTDNGGTIYMGALFFGIINLMFSGFGEMAMTVFRLPVFYKQRDMLFYPAWAYSVPIWVTKIPISFLETGVWVGITYYVIGYSPEAGRFFRMFLLLFLLHQMALALFRLNAAIGRNMIIAGTFGSFVLLVIIVLGGFIISRDNIRSWWIWGYWISPLMYAQNSIGVNEFLTPRWQKPSNTTENETIGIALLKSRGLFPYWYWYWIGVGAMVGYVFLFNILFTFALQYLDPTDKLQASKSEDAAQTGKAKRIKGNPYAQQSTNGTLAGDNNKSTAEELGISSTGDESSKKQTAKGMILPFQPLSLAFDDVSYFVDMPAEMRQQGITETRLQLLRDVSGTFRPGTLTALVGVSGAGKTTLMDVLAGRKTGGYIEGNISISGYPKKQETFARISGYCEQTDIHSPNVTVHESLVYSAWLRLSKDVDRTARMKFVEEVMDLVELTSLKDALVGLPGVTGLSTEQRKRLTIAVELVANPSIIFMDEPTSGLDARAAAIVMRTVRNTVDTGRTVVCTIHQPSIDIFEAFDELLLLKRGGQVIYSGSLGRHSAQLIQYFEAIDGVPKIPDGYNPATWMLEVSSASVEAHLGVDFAEIFRNSSLHQSNKVLIKELSTPAPGSEDIHFETRYARSFVTQCMACLWKQHWSYWRNPQYNVIRILFTTVTALIFGSVFWKLGKKRTSQLDLFNLMGSMYVAVLFIGVQNSTTVQPVVSVERTVFYREKAAGMYSALPYAFAQVAIEIPYILIQALIYGGIVYSMISLEWTAAKFLWFVFFMYMAFLYFTFYGMLTVALTPNEAMAAILAATFYGLWNLFSGFLIPRNSIPVWWRWYYWACPVAWTLYGLITSQLGDVRDIHFKNDPSQPSVAEFIKDYFGFHHSFLGTVGGVHVGLVLMFAFVFAFSVKYLNFQRR